MQYLSFYLTIAFIIILAILRGRAGHLEYKVRNYLQKNHPEKAKEFGCQKGGWFNEFKLVWSLYKNDSIKDSEFICLSRKAKNAQTFLLCTLVFGIIIIITVVILYHLSL